MRKFEPTLVCTHLRNSYVVMCESAPPANLLEGSLFLFKLFCNNYLGSRSELFLKSRVINQLDYFFFSGEKSFYIKRIVPPTSLCPPA